MRLIIMYVWVGGVMCLPYLVNQMNESHKSIPSAKNGKQSTQIHQYIHKYMTDREEERQTAHTYKIQLIDPQSVSFVHT